MATRTAPSPLSSRYRAPEPRRSRARPLIGFLLVIALVAAAFVAAVLLWSGAKLVADQSALARVDVQALGGSLLHARAVDSHGKRIPLRVQDGRLTPKRKLTPGEKVSVRVLVKRPSWLGWALGKTRRETLTVRAPVAKPTSRWLTVGSGSDVEVGFDRKVVAAAYGDGTSLAHHRVATPTSTVSLGHRGAAGSMQIATAARSWERLGKPETVTWFPKASSPVAVVSPSPGGKVSPADPLRLTFSDPVDKALGAARPKLTPDVPGSWSKADSHTLVFTPSGYGVGFDRKITAELPKSVAITGPSGAGLHMTRSVEWTVPPGSVLRLHQLLAQAGYLPVKWKPAAQGVAHTPRAETHAAVDPPTGKFVWRYPNTPAELKSMWTADKGSEITRGAVMKFQQAHGLDADAVAGPAMWKVLLADAVKGKKNPNEGAAGGYSYVYVHRDSGTQTMTLWHNGKTIITSPANTGVAAAPTDLGTFPVFEHLSVTTMSGTNPGGSHYSDPGIQFVSYFNGGDALHAFNRATFGTPQSVGCVELPLASAAKEYPYTDIGTLVTVET